MSELWCWRVAGRIVRRYVDSNAIGSHPRPRVSIQVPDKGLVGDYHGAMCKPLTYRSRSTVLTVDVFLSLITLVKTRLVYLNLIHPVAT